MVEIDLLLVRYLERRWSVADDAERSVFLQLLDCEDDTLWRWLIGLEPPQDKDLDALVQRIRELPPV
ncbi:MAG: succinate dehydrogenase assembly factor 2 [Proteobacteria bacterium]|nr:succinate dehydrogenase assembly factor 2 [Pseudomonadota bacterium]